MAKKGADQAEDWYAVLGVEFGTDLATVTKAYRKLALKYHPDKGGDKDLFHKLSEAYQVLGDEQKKEKYDKEQRAVISSKRRQKEQMDKMDAKRRKMREDLMKREQKAAAAENVSRKEQVSAHAAKLNEKLRINRLREENARRMEEEAERRARAQAAAKQPTDGFISPSPPSVSRPAPQSSSPLDTRAAIRVKWKRKDISQSDDSLAIIFRKYGEILQISISAKGTSARILFTSPLSARSAVKGEYGSDMWKDLYVIGDHMATAKMWDETERERGKEKEENRSTEREKNIPPSTRHDDFEREVLRNLQRAVNQQKVKPSQPSPPSSSATGLFAAAGQQEKGKEEAAGGDTIDEEEVMRRMLAAAAAKKKS